MLGDDIISFNKVTSEQSRLPFLTFADIFEVDGKLYFIAVSCLSLEISISELGNVS